MPQQIAQEALDFARLIGAGETVGWAEATAEPMFLTRLLDAQAARCAPFRVFFPLTFSHTLGTGSTSRHKLLEPPTRFCLSIYRKGWYARLAIPPVSSPSARDVIKSENVKGRTT